MTTTEETIITPPNQLNLEYTGKALHLAGRILLTAFTSLLIIPAPWACARFVKWLVSKVKINNGTYLDFVGLGRQIILPVVIAILFNIRFSASNIKFCTINLQSLTQIFYLVKFFIIILINFVLIRWFIKKIKLDKKLRLLLRVTFHHSSC